MDFVRKGHQVMVFVHARNATVKGGMAILEAAQNKGHTELFLPEVCLHLTIFFFVFANFNLTNIF